ncbi:helix-turn-helix domain-containing protein [Paenibacillus dendritiformis]|uniref:DNA-binding protein n=1 Tax=Paenibacillus dendritiformis C454 TaxID=1131935 RepID=H3SDN4_9BACL|nr:helix-turn-helix transcriptional regulator [Paenibacillus dendritiformis]EHQ62823.1 DNA-binding protein [Paenibacillus dendritiformis C454]CAH8770804.1 helix-turn-helix domain-containing protein [Paenibacillus dendritiformis]
MSTLATKPKSLGELIHYHRQKKEMTLSKLQEAVGIDKGSLSRIENSEVKRPDFQSILSIAAVLDIPHSDIVEKYIEIGHKSEVVYTILQNELTTLEHPSLIPKIAAKFLESPNEDSLYLVGKLYRDTEPIANDSIKLSLYDLILDYSRSHGIMPYIAKSMYQRYLIERNDFSRLKETYYSGKYILHYIDFLPEDEQLELHYKLGVHAYNLRFYNESIDHCKKVLAEDGGQSPYKIYALGVLRDAHFSIREYKEAEVYSIQYKQFNYPHTQENIGLMDALFAATKGNNKQAIEQLLSFLETCSDISAIPASRQLLRLYLQQNSLEDAKNLLDNCKINPPDIGTCNPLICSRYADYLQVKGEYYLAVGDYDKCITYMVESALWHSKVNDTAKEKECLNKVMRIHLEHNVSPQSTFEKLSAYYQSAKEMEDQA